MRMHCEAKPMRVVLSTIGRFHSFDLARQIHRHGSLQAIFTGYPHFKLTNERLPANKIHTFPWLHAPYMGFGHWSNSLRRSWEWHDRQWFDRYVSRRIPDCDVFCALSGCGLESGKAAQDRGVKYVCDRGSTHIRYQDRVLREEYERHGIRFAGIDPRIVDREEREYALADAITVPSTFALRTFLEFGVPERKLHLLPYGADSHRFHPVATPDQKSFHVLFAGTISVRKGVSYLLQAFEKLDHPRKHLTLIGRVARELRPEVRRIAKCAGVSVLGHLPQSALNRHMSISDVLVLPSIEEGLALVQAQALACGCPVIATRSTGAEDLITSGVEGYVIPERDPDAIAARLQMLADGNGLRAEMRKAARRRAVSWNGWRQYGDAAHELYRKVLEQ